MDVLIYLSWFGKHDPQVGAVMFGMVVVILVGIYALYRVWRRD